GRCFVTCTLVAVFPVPNTSYDAPSLGVMSFQEMLSCSAKCVTGRFGTYFEGRRSCAGKLFLKLSYRIPPYSDHRCSVQRSCAKKPKSRSTSTCTGEGESW